MSTLLIIVIMIGIIIFPFYVYTLSKAYTLGKIIPIKNEILKIMEVIYGKEEQK